jgi:hypothetical protein
LKFSGNRTKIGVEKKNAIIFRTQKNKVDMNSPANFLTILEDQVLAFDRRMFPVVFGQIHY